jgi:hypothetical protein
MTFVNGTAEFRELGRKLKAAADKDLPDEIYSTVRDAMTPLQGDIRRSAVAVLPRRGGLGALIAQSPISIGKRPGGISLKGSSGHDIAAMDRGRLRHPLFGDRRHWYTQPVAVGWWSKPTERSKSSIQAAVERAMENIKQKLEA